MMIGCQVRLLSSLRDCFYICAVSFVGSLLVTSASDVVAFDDHIDDVMYQDPQFPEYTTKVVYSDQLKPLWLEALQQPDAELQRMAAETIAHAHEWGLEGLEDTVPELRDILKRESLDPTVRRAVVNALVTLDAKESAAQLAALLDTATIAIAQLIEPALARWDFPPVRELWRQRLGDATTEQSRMQLAIACLGAVGDLESSSALHEIVKDTNALFPLRLAAARALSQIKGGNNVALARAMSGESANAALLSVSLLLHSTSAEAIELLRQLARQDSTSVVHAALQSLYAIDPKLVLEFTEVAIGSRDANVRSVIYKGLVHKSDAPAILQLGPTLNDVNPNLRRYVTRSLLQLARDPDRRQTVIDVASDAISQADWRGIEQGLVLIGALDHEPAAPKLLELLAHKRPEVSVAAAWSLRKLAVKETLSAMLEQAQRQTKVAEDHSYEAKYYHALDLQLCQLFQAFGELNYREAEPLMRRYIPKLKLLFDGRARPAAVWAIGKLNEGKVDEALASQLAERLADNMSMEPEIDPVRQMSAIAIGRMNAKSQIAVLNRFAIEAPSHVGLACAWSLERMTGEAREFNFEQNISVSGWFLTPREGRKATGKE